MVVVCGWVIVIQLVSGWVSVVRSTYEWVAAAGPFALCSLLHLVQAFTESPLSLWFGWVSVSEWWKMKLGKLKARLVRV